MLDWLSASARARAGGCVRARRARGPQRPLVAGPAVVTAVRRAFRRESERCALEVDLGPQLGAVFATAAPSELVELRFGVCEALLGSGLVVARAGGGALRGRARSRGRSRSAWSIASGSEALAVNAWTTRSGTRSRCGSVAGQVGFERRGREVEAGFSAGARAGDVAPLLQRAPVFDEDEGSFDRRSLGGVTGQGVAVVEVLRRVGDRRPLGALPGRCAG